MQWNGQILGAHLLSSTDVYICAIWTSVKIQNITISPRKFSDPDAHCQYIDRSSLSDKATIQIFSSVDLFACFRTSCEGIMKCVHFLARFFSFIRIFEIHPCCCMYQQFVPSYLQTVSCHINILPFVYTLSYW